MSKIHKALEHAQQERKGLKVLSGAPIHENSTSKHPKYENEHEMIHLYHTINSLTQDSKNKVIQFIGSCKGEGTSTLIRDFVRVAASMLDEPVLLLDANRQSCHASFFGIRPDSGLAEVILKKKPLKEVLHKIENSRLFMGQISLNGDYITSIFGSSRIEEVFDELKKEFKLVIIDTPSASESTDAIALTRMANGVILVVESENTRWQIVNGVKERIIKHHGNILGVILNKRKYYIPEFIYKRL